MIFPLLLAVAADVLLPVQAGLNAQLVIGSPVAAALISFLVGTAGLAVVQMLSSLILDQYGLVGFTVHPVSSIRLVGAMLVIVGVILIQR